MFSATFNLSSANAVNLDDAKNLSFCKGLHLYPESRRFRIKKNNNNATNVEIAVYDSSNFITFVRDALYTLCTFTFL